jgi:hypothetical protein
LYIWFGCGRQLDKEVCWGMLLVGSFLKCRQGSGRKENIKINFRELGFEDE